MRELKFRAINIKGEFIFGCYVTDNEDYHAIVSPLNKSEMKNTPVDVDTVGQFTGLQDASGVDIYEGDIVYIAGYGALCVSGIGDLVILIDALAENDIGGIIGNIHQNPELLAC